MTLPSRIREALPRGDRLSERAWSARRRFTLALLWVNGIGALVFAIAGGRGIVPVAAAVTPVAGAIVFAWRYRRNRTATSVAIAFGLAWSSMAFLHLTGGRIEMHFHPFVMIGVIALYQRWGPLLAGLGSIVVHDLVFGTLDPSMAIAGTGATGRPWASIGVQMTFLVAAAAAGVAAWRLNEHQAAHDPLTSLATRVVFSEQLEHALRESRPDAHVGVLFVDLDDFKGVNDTLGHDAGDQVLLEVAARLQAGVRPGDLVARFGGDEFAILMRSLADVAAAEAVASRLHEVLAAPLHVAGKELLVGASVGVAVSEPGTTSPSGLLRDADVAMYVAKGRGTGCSVVYEQRMGEAAIERVRLEADLRRAVEQQEFLLRYQPIVDLASGAILGVEALVRWVHPVDGLVYPSAFIGAAEQNGTIVPIGRWILGEALAQLRSWDDAAPGDQSRTMSVNVSARQLADPSFVGEMSSALRLAGIAPERLIVELTESVLLQDEATTIEQLAALKAIGVQVALDDFGTGYSSLSYLRRFPVDILKIDRSFVDRLGLGPEESSLAQAILKIARGLSLRVIAEGVERGDQANELIRLGCASAQGFYFAEPLEPEGMTRLLCSRTRLKPAPEPKGAVLIVDDDEATRRAMARWFERAGYTVRQARTGEEALKLARRFRHRAIVLDVQLPDLDGFEVLRELKSDRATAAVPVVHISGARYEPDDRVKGLSRGADRYLVKPVRGDELLANVEALLRSVRATEAGDVAGVA